MDRHVAARAGDADYSVIGANYASFRQTEPRIAALIQYALGAARTVINVGAGAGSYEPLDRVLTPVEPSAEMRAQRPPYLPAAIDAIAEALPFPDGCFDAGMATFTVHQWRNLQVGLAELRRVTRGPVLILTCDPDAVQQFWLNAYAPDVLAAEARRYPAIDRISQALGGVVEVVPVPIPFDCRDGFNEAYYGRPERLLEGGARLACSAWSFVDASVTARAIAALRRELDDGVWDARYGKLRVQPEFHGSLRLVVSQP